MPAHLHLTQHCVSDQLSKNVSSQSCNSQKNNLSMRPFLITAESEDDYATDEHEYEDPVEDSHPASNAITYIIFTVLLILCINTIVDLEKTSKDAMNSIAEKFQSNYRAGEDPEEMPTGSNTLDEFYLTNFFRADEDTGELVGLENEKYPRDGAAIAILTTNTVKDVDDLLTALKSLIFLRRDMRSEHPAPVLIFHEGNLSMQQKQNIVGAVQNLRPVSFPIIDFTQFPKGLNINDGSNKKFVVQGRDNPWGYQQMIRFWITRIWEHPALEPFETIMRMDTDSCFKGENEELPHLKNNNIVYHSQFVGVENNADFTNDLLNHAELFLDKYKIKPSNPMLWGYAKLVWKEQQTLPLFMTNFEVTRKSWMQKSYVKRWHESLTENKPYGIFTHRWGDAVTRFLMIAMIAKNLEVDTSYANGYFHKEKCKKKDVESAITRYLNE